MPAISERGFSAADLQGVAKALHDYAAEIERLTEEMQAAKLESLTVKGVAELKRADERIGIFCDNVRASLRQKTRPKMFGVEVGGGAEAEADESLSARPRRRGRPPKKTK